MARLPAGVASGSAATMLGEIDMLQTGSGSGLTVLVLQMAAIGLVFYFLILRPSSQARKKHAALLANLKKGDEVMTSGGLVGKVRDIKEIESDGMKESRVTLETGTPDDGVRRLVKDMFETMDASKGVGLAANQVGVARRVAVVDADGDRFVMIDPVILESEGRATAEEGCLSIPDIYGDVSRPERVVLEATDLEGNR